MTNAAQKQSVSRTLLSDAGDLRFDFGPLLHATGIDLVTEVTVFHAIGSRANLDNILEQGLKPRRALAREGTLPDARVSSSTDVWRESLIYAGLRPPPAEYTYLAFRVLAGSVEVGNQSLARNGLYDVPPEYTASVMSLAEYMARSRIEPRLPRHPVTAMPISQTQIGEVRATYGTIGYSPEVLISRIVPPSEFLKVQRKDA